MMRMADRDRQRIGGIGAGDHAPGSCIRTMCAICPLSAWPTPTTVFLTVLGAYSPDREPALRGHQHRDRRAPAPA